MRVAFVLRSAEVQPLFRDLCDVHYLSKALVASTCVATLSILTPLNILIKKVNPSSVLTLMSSLSNIVRHALKLVFILNYTHLRKRGCASLVYRQFSNARQIHPGYFKF